MTDDRNDPSPAHFDDSWQHCWAGLQAKGDVAALEEYERQVREEYRWVPGFLFQLKRRQILAQFLARDALFNTPAIRAALEAAARGNLADSLRNAKA